MDTYLIGNLLGRLLVSYFLTWVILFLFSGFNWRNTFVRSRKWYGLLILTCLFVLGVSGGLNQVGGI